MKGAPGVWIAPCIAALIVRCVCAWVNGHVAVSLLRVLIKVEKHYIHTCQSPSLPLTMASKLEIQLLHTLLRNGLVHTEGPGSMKLTKQCPLQKAKRKT